MRNGALTVATLIGLVAGRMAAAQSPPPPTPTPATPVAEEPATEEKPERIPYRPIESNVIVALPSVDVSPAGTLALLVTHRFIDDLSHGNINNFFTLDSGNTWGFGLWYSPIENLSAGFYRTSELATYEASVQYALPRLGGFAWSLRAGEDWRTEVFDNNTIRDPVAASPKSSFFAQAVLAYSFGPYARITVVPTYLQRTNRRYADFNQPPPGDLSCRPSGNPPGLPQYQCSGLYEDIFNVPVAASIAITHSITVHGEVTPRLSDVNSRGVGWAVTVEKSLLRHRFAFFVGNQRATTVDQYTGSVPVTRSPNNVYIGFNLYRAWKLN
jgi:hypothetical protein